MQRNYLITVDEFCTSHHIEISFLSSLHENGLIEITNIDEKSYIDASQLLQLEKFVHFYYELDINLEGIETISYLLQRIGDLQDRITLLQNRLRLYE